MFSDSVSCVDGGFGDVGGSTGITKNFGDGLLATLAISQQEFDSPVEVILPEPFSLSLVLTFTA